LTNQLRIFTTGSSPSQNHLIKDKTLVNIKLLMGNKLILYTITTCQNTRENHQFVNFTSNTKDYLTRTTINQVFNHKINLILNNDNKTLTITIIKGSFMKSMTLRYPVMAVMKMKDKIKMAINFNRGEIRGIWG
jgi:hypothetical protein